MLLRLLLVALTLATAPVVAAQDAVAPEPVDSLQAALPSASTDAAEAALDEGVLDAESAPAYYLTKRNVRLRGGIDGTPFGAALPFRDAVRVLARREEAGSGEAAWVLVQHASGRGWIQEDAISNIWIRIDKSERTTYLYAGDELVRTYASDVSPSDEDKVRRAARTETDHHRIPEGTFYVTRRHGASEYYLAFVLSYPNVEHAMRGLRQGLITNAEYDAIVRAQASFREPPMGTKLGGMIEIHGNGSGRRRAWTRGCVALRNVHMDELWETVAVGTPVIVER